MVARVARASIGVTFFHDTKHITIIIIICDFACKIGGQTLECLLDWMSYRRHLPLPIRMWKHELVASTHDPHNVNATANVLMLYAFNAEGWLEWLVHLVVVLHDVVRCFQNDGSVLRARHNR